jgi:hypothetical protein
MTSFCNLEAIILQLFHDIDVSNILLRKVVFYQLKQCHIPQGLNQEHESLPYASVSPFTTKHFDRYMLRVETIIDFLCDFKAVAK